MSIPVNLTIYNALQASVAKLFDLVSYETLENNIGLQFGPYRILIKCQTASLLEAIADQFGLIIIDSQSAPDLQVSIVVAEDILARLQESWFAEEIAKPHSSTSFRHSEMRMHVVFDDQGLATLFALDVKTGRAVYAAASGARLKSVEGAYPLLLLLRMWAEQTPYLWAHGAAVGNEKAAVLLTGIGGAGKSSTSLAVTGDRLKLIGDDHILISPDLQAYCIYCTVRLREDMFEHFRKLDSWFGDDWFHWHDKPSQILPSEKHRHFLSRAPLKAVVLLRHDAEEPLTFRQLPQSAGFRAITPVTVTRHYSEPAAIFEKVARVISALPVYEFRTSRNLLSMRKPFEAFVDELGNADG